VSDNTGAIKIGNTNLNDIDAKWWRSQIDLLQQESYLFNDTIYKNVTKALPHKVARQPRLRKARNGQSACRKAYADEFISPLPKGYDTIVGEFSIKLNGGQRQRLAIARAIVKQPSIFILDEATSAIDVRTQLVVQAALDRVAQNRRLSSSPIAFDNQKSRKYRSAAPGQDDRRKHARESLVGLRWRVPRVSSTCKCSSWARMNSVAPRRHPGYGSHH